MAISWGAWDYGSSSAGFRVGIEVTTSAVTSASASVTFTVKVYVEAMYNVDDEMTVTYGGNISGSSTQNLTTGSSGGTKLWGTLTHTYNYSTWGSSPGSRSFSGSLSGVYNGANPTKTVTVTIPARPYAKPAAPTSVVQTRNSDTQHTVTWVRNATASAPYTSLTVQRRVYSGSTWSAWATVATTTSTATSYVDKTVTANAGYQYQVKANNAAGSSAYVIPTAQYNTPAAPSNVAAVLSQTGTSIRVDWKNNHYTSSNVTYTIQRSVAGGAFANVVTGLASGTTSWIDNAPGAGTNQYQVAASHTVPPTTSAFVASNTVSTTVPPLAPTLLSPNGTAVDWTLPQTLTWQHNPGGDQAAQSSFIIEYSNDSGATWLPLNGAGTTSTVSSYTVPANTLTNGTTRLWRVRTRGVTSAGYGANSSSATIVGSLTPVTAITGPPTTVLSLPATATWTYTQGNGSAQTAWELELVEGTQVRETASGTTALSYALTYAVQQGASYTLRVRTRSAAGIWSAWATRALTINLLPPAHVTTTAEFQAATGTTVLHLEATAAVGGSEVAATSATVERLVEGDEWVTLYRDLALPSDVLDLLPSTTKLNQYRITAKSATPTYRTEAIVDVLPPAPFLADDRKDRQWVFVNYGDGFGTVLRFRSAPKLSVTSGREKNANRFAGRTKPVPQLGQARSRTVSVGGSLAYDKAGVNDDEVFLWDSPPEDWDEAGEESEVVCYRDFRGRRIFGILSDVTVGDEFPGLASVGFTVTEVDFREVYA